MLIKDAASKMKINYNTAKTIIRIMKVDNRVFKKKKVSKHAQKRGGKCKKKFHFKPMDQEKPNPIFKCQNQ